MDALNIEVPRPFWRAPHAKAPPAHLRHPPLIFVAPNAADRAPTAEERGNINAMHLEATQGDITGNILGNLNGYPTFILNPQGNPIGNPIEDAIPRIPPPPPAKAGGLAPEAILARARGELTRTQRIGGTLVAPPFDVINGVGPTNEEANGILHARMLHRQANPEQREVGIIGGILGPLEGVIGVPRADPNHPAPAPRAEPLNEDDLHRSMGGMNIAGPIPTNNTGASSDTTADQAVRQERRRSRQRVREADRQGRYINRLDERLSASINDVITALDTSSDEGEVIIRHRTGGPGRPWVTAPNPGPSVHRDRGRRNIAEAIEDAWDQ